MASIRRSREDREASVSAVSLAASAPPAKAPLTGGMRTRLPTSPSLAAFALARWSVPCLRSRSIPRGAMSSASRERQSRAQTASSVSGILEPQGGFQRPQARSTCLVSSSPGGKSTVAPFREPTMSSALFLPGGAHVGMSIGRPRSASGLSSGQGRRVGPAARMAARIDRCLGKRTEQVPKRTSTKPSG